MFQGLPKCGGRAASSRLPMSVARVGSLRGRRAVRAGRAAAVAALVGLVGAFGGCASGRTADNPMEAGSELSDEIELLVRNLNFNQVTVYTARGASVNRLGIVPGKGDATFTFRWHLPDIQLRVRQLAGGEFLTETLPVSPGELLELIVPSHWD